MIHGYGNFEENKAYDYIYTPVQPLDKFVVCENNKYGFIDARTFEEIVAPVSDTVEELCNKYKYNVVKYTEDLYIMNKTVRFRRRVHQKYCYSYFIDTHRIVKCRWGGLEEKMQDWITGEPYTYSLYDELWEEYIPVNRYGYFYNLFDCRAYDSVINVIGEYYIVRKKNRFGLIDSEFNVLLLLSYKSIRLAHLNAFRDMPLFIVTCVDGKQFLYNPTIGLQTRNYDSLEDAAYSDFHNLLYYFDDYIVYEDKGKYGLLSVNGEIIEKARFDLYRGGYGSNFGKVYFKENFHDVTYPFYIENDMYYGKIPVANYDVCIKISVSICGYFYITKKNGRYGFLDCLGREMNLPAFEDVFFAKQHFYGYTFKSIAHKSEFFMIAIVNGKYYLYKINTMTTHELIISECEEMEMLEECKYYCGNEYYYPYVYFKKNGIEGYVNEDGLIVSTETFDKIEPVKVDNVGRPYFLVYKNGKVGLLGDRRNLLLACIYDKVIKITRCKSIVVENGQEKNVENGSCFNFNYSDPYAELDDDEDLSNKSYSRYSGSYAQDEMWYSDDEIDTLFEGDPDAYWNID